MKDFLLKFKIYLKAISRTEGFWICMFMGIFSIFLQKYIFAFIWFFWMPCSAVLMLFLENFCNKKRKK